MEITTFLAIIGVAALTAALIWLALLFRRPRLRRAEGEAGAEAMLEVGRALGLETFYEEELFGQKVRILEGEFKEMHVELEINRSPRDLFCRITIEFPHPLAQDLHVYSDNRSSFVTWLRRMREQKTGDEEFDDEFIVLTRNAERTGQILNPATRYQLLRLAMEVERLRLDDNSLFIFSSETLDDDSIKSLLKKSLEIGDRLLAMAKEMGPTGAHTGAAKYNQAAASVMQRGAPPESEELPQDGTVEQTRGGAE